MKHKSVFLRLARSFIAAATVTVLVSPAASATVSRPPNIVLITADDLGCLLSCYGEKRIATPKLDAFAASGVLFRNAYVAESSCSQSRASLLTGRWPHQCGQVGLAGLGFTMHPGQPTLPALLKTAGYRTGIIGKLHVLPTAAFPFDWMPAKEKMNALATRNVRWVAEQSREFFASAKAADKPFFYYVNFFDPHVPLTRETDQIAGLPEKPLTAADIREPLPMGAPPEVGNHLATARLLNAVMRVDAGMGLLLDELKAAGFEDNTIVIFVGDNGTAMPRGKTWSYETGVHVPMLVRWPGVTKPGQVRSENVSLVDVMPTLLAATGINAPGPLAGAALQPLLRGGPANDWREFLFTEENFHEPQMFHGQRTVRDGRYKLLLNLATFQPHSEMRSDSVTGEWWVEVGLTSPQSPVELFDLQTDPDETKNLANDPAHAATRRRLEAALRNLRETEAADPLLDPARARRWKDAAAHWGRLPRVKAGLNNIVRIPSGELDLLK